MHIVCVKGLLRHRICVSQDQMKTKYLQKEKYNRFPFYSTNNYAWHNIVQFQIFLSFLGSLQGL